MATSAVDICNLALVRAGVSKVISSLEEASVEAGVCRVIYPTALEATLAAAPWPFATKRAVLAPLASGGRGGFAFSYALPPDCIAVQEVFAGRRLREDQKVPFAIENEAETRILLTDHEDVEVKYTARVENPLVFHPLFVQALAWNLAEDLAISLSKDDDATMHYASRANKRYIQTIHQAIALAVGERQPDQEPESVFLSSRRF